MDSPAQVVPTSCDPWQVDYAARPSDPSESRQFWSVFAGTSRWKNGEIALVSKSFRYGMQDYFAPKLSSESGREYADRREQARVWIFEDRGEDPFSFAWYCTFVLSCDPASARRAITVSDGTGWLKGQNGTE